MRLITLITAGLLVAGCQDSFNISALPEHYRELFREAARIEGVGTNLGTIVRDEWDWSAELGTWPGAYGHAEHAGQLTSAIGLYCRIILNTTQMTACDVGGFDQRFLQISRHEIRHCTNGSDHDPRPDRLMYAPSPCWSVD